MRIYSNSFFHFTKDIDSIEGIIHEGFKIHFCKEELYTDEGHIDHIGIPMSSFCDIPLSFISQINYGKYGIGMSRRWGIAHELQPVIYYPNNKRCQSTQMVIMATKAFHEQPSHTEAFRILGYAKPLYKIEKNKDLNNNNYIEREWRKVYASRMQFKWKTQQEYQAYRGDDELNPKTAVGVPLRFSADDVNFIIIPRNDAPNIRDYIMRSPIRYIGGKNTVVITNNDRELLLSKLVTYEDLIENM